MSQQKKKDDRSRNWVIVFYPDSCPDNYLDVIRGWCVKAFLSPLHELDVNVDDTEKKPHYHLLLMFSGKKSLEQIQELSDQLSGVRVLQQQCAVRDCKAMARYLIHMDNPEKFQYSPADVINFGGVDYIEYVQTSTDVYQILDDITIFCIENSLQRLDLLLAYCIKYRPDWARVIYTHTIFVNYLLRSITWALDPNKPSNGYLYVKRTGKTYTLHDLLRSDEEIVENSLTSDNKCDNI